jgi:hypothetical protein
VFITVNNRLTRWPGCRNSSISEEGASAGGPTARSLFRRHPKRHCNFWKK